MNKQGLLGGALSTGALPWYKSKIIVGALVSVVTKAAVALGLAPELANNPEVGNLIALGIGAAADAVVIMGRVKQVEAPAIVAGKTAATRIEGELADQQTIANALNNNDDVEVPSWMQR